ncbi:MAG: DUF6677 family protein [Candidatus Acidiferrales bacterium]
MDETSEPREAQPPEPAVPSRPDAAAAPNAASPASTPPASENAPFIAWLAAAAGWFVPGLGHLLLRRWGRAAAIFLSVGAMAIAGYRLQGQVYSIRTGDVYGTLGQWAEIGAGAFYFLWRVLEPAGANLARASGDVGTRLLAMAGLLNFLCVADAFEIARRAKS